MPQFDVTLHHTPGLRKPAQEVAFECVFAATAIEAARKVARQHKMAGQCRALFTECEQDGEAFAAVFTFGDGFRDSAEVRQCEARP